MKHNLKYLGKFILPVILAGVVLLGLIGPVAARQKQPTLPPEVEHLAAAAVLSTTQIILSSQSSGSPALKVGNDGSFLALVYNKIGGGKAVHVKSANLVDGWVTTRYVGSGENPRLAFALNSNTTVFVVWQAGDNKSIKFASCTLITKIQPNCVQSTNVTVVNSGNVDTPDIVVDSNGAIHVTWVRDLNGRNVETAVSTDNGQSWSAPNLVQPGPGVGNGFTSPKLAFANNTLHLALRRFTIADNLGTAILYYRATNLTTPAWTLTKSFQKATEVNFQYNNLANPTIAASGNKVYLAWDGHISVGFAGNGFGLMRATSADTGLTWSSVSHITENNSAALNVQSPPKLFEDASDFAPEIALQPSLTISGSGYALVWQERPFGSTPGCQEEGNGSSEIYHAYTGTTWVLDMLADNENEYTVDPDLAIDGSGTRHFVYMRDADTEETCIGGEAQDYGISYRGPFTITINDFGEDPTTPLNPDGSGPEGPPSGNPNGPPFVYMPIISKN